MDANKCTIPFPNPLFKKCRVADTVKAEALPLLGLCLLPINAKQIFTLPIWGGCTLHFSLFRIFYVHGSGIPSILPTYSNYLPTAVRFNQGILHLKKLNPKERNCSLPKNLSPEGILVLAQFINQKRKRYWSTNLQRAHWVTHFNAGLCPDWLLFLIRFTFLN